ncbi:MAG: polyphosphate kinase 1 [Actinomycetota bacterium]|nr:polyphosphate kinase 1 [Actinomycetota bacterium]
MSPTVPKKAARPTIPTIGAGEPDRIINRELSQLDFLDRLLDLAEDRRQGLLERAKFLAIFSSNLDDFFQTRVAGLKDQVAAGLRTRSPDGRSPAEQLDAIRERSLGLVGRSTTIFHDGLVPDLAKAGVRFSDWQSLDDDDRSFLVGVFHDRIFPVLTPLAVDPAHPFPYISSLSLNLGVVVTDPVRQEERFARVKVPPLLPRFVVMPDGERFVPLEQVIAAHLDMLFPEMVLERHVTFRVTRNADAELTNGGAEDLLAAVEMELRRRRFGEAVRLEVESGIPADTVEMLLQELAIGPEDVYESDAPLALGGLWALYSLERSDLHDEPWTPVVPPRLAPAREGHASIFAVLAEKEIFVQHPYDSFSASVEELIAQAAHDPATLAIKQTLYRTSGDSPIVASLIEAAESGKQVAVLVELKARFDEQANIGWARALEEAGVHVVYGLVGLKTHAKAALVVRSEDEGIRRYCHVGTGNYNSETARNYEDVGILTADADVGADLTEVFNLLTGYSRRSSYRKAVLAPVQLRRTIVELLEEQARLGPEGRVVIKANGLDDPQMVDALYATARTGVPIDLIIRGICCLRPGVPGLSDTIRVRSLLGRFLEHSRILSFGRPEHENQKIYIGSADLRGRNLDRRVELMVPLVDPGSRERVREILELCLADDTSSWELSPAGDWKRLDGRKVSAQDRLAELATERNRSFHSAEGIGSL